MEQKQLDELDESYFGEEFIDDEAEEVRIEDTKKRKTRKLKDDLLVSQAWEDNKPVAMEDEVKVVKKNEKVKMEIKNPEIKTGSQANKEESPKEKNDFKNEFTAKPGKVPVETSSPVDPWKKEEPKDDLFKGNSTWKMLTGVMLILLVFSVFTHGFQFNKANTVTGAVTLQEAQQKALDFVNKNLLQPPFVAEVQSSEDTGSLYKVTISVAGQNVDSYITKDGKMFFPQGFDTSMDLSQLSADSASNSSSGSVQDNAAADSGGVPGGDSGSNLNGDVVNDEVVESGKSADGAAPSGSSDTSASKELTVNAKRWLFQPSELSVKLGDKVKLRIVPEGITFTFSLPGLAVKKDVLGETFVEFTADKKGTFEFTCSSCDEWRGMKGQLIVE